MKDLWRRYLLSKLVEGCSSKCLEVRSTVHLANEICPYIRWFTWPQDRAFNAVKVVDLFTHILVAHLCRPVPGDFLPACVPSRPGCVDKLLENDGLDLYPPEKQGFHPFLKRLTNYPSSHSSTPHPLLKPKQPLNPHIQSLRVESLPS